MRKTLRSMFYRCQTPSLCLYSSAKPLFSWAESLWKNPLATTSHVVQAAWEEAFFGEPWGIATDELKKSCFSFGYRVNSIAPYTSVMPGGVFGSILKSLTRSFMTVFYPPYAAFRGMFALMIAVICKAGVLKAFNKLFQRLANITRWGLRGLRILFRRFGEPGS